MSVYVRKDHWTPTEDQIVRAAVMKYGTNQWTRVASLLVRKSPVQCRARWFEHLTPKISQAEWSAQEDRALLKLAKMMPNMWRSISATLGSRTATQCLERWTRLEGSAIHNGDRGDTDIEESENSEPDSDSERQMMAEARARLANSLGKKAQRKQRERQADDDAFRQTIAQHRLTGAAIRTKRSKFNIDYSAGIPFGVRPQSGEDKEVRFESMQATVPLHHSMLSRPPRRAGRPPLALPPPVMDTPANRIAVASKADQERVRRKLSGLPPPQTASTLETLVVDVYEDDQSGPAQEPLETRSESESDLESRSPLLVALDDVFALDNPQIEISSAARALLDAEIADRQERLQAPPRIPKDSSVLLNENLTALNAKYSRLKESVIKSARARNSSALTHTNQ